MTQQGAQIRLNGTTFSGINICGSLISNGNARLPNTNFEGISTDKLGPQSRRLYERVEQFQRNMSSQRDSYYYTNPKPEDEEELEFWYFQDNFIEILNSQFHWFNYKSKPTEREEQTIVSESSGAWKQAMILNVDDFAGTITIQASNFTDNNFLFETCDLYDASSFNHESLPLDSKSRSVSLENNWGYLKRESDWKFDKI